MTEQQADYIWWPNTKDHGKEFSENEILSRSAPYVHPGEYSGVYFLIDCYEIVYVGQSVDVKSRLAQHSKSSEGVGGKNFNRYFFIWCSDREERNRLEAYYILRFRPKYNIAIPKGIQI